MAELHPISLEPPRLSFDKLPNLEANREERYHDYEFPMISVILPTYNCAQSLVDTMESILRQDYPSFEIVVIDAGSTDKTLEVVKGFQSEKVQVYTVSKYQRYEMFNKGVSQANGVYICFMLSGEYYVSMYTFRNMMEAALDHQMPHLLYCGSLIRDSRHEVRMLLRPFTNWNLRHGLLPTTLVSCWFHRDIFNSVGKFDIGYKSRGFYDLLCRVIEQKTIRTVCVRRVYTDSEVFVITREAIYEHFSENGKIVYKHFGFWAFLSWLFSQKDTGRLWHSWMKSVKQAFLGR